MILEGQQSMPEIAKAQRKCGPVGPEQFGTEVKKKKESWGSEGISRVQEEGSNTTTNT